MRSDLTVAEQNQSVVRLKAKNPNTLCSDRVRRRPPRLLASQSSRAISQPIRRCSIREWYERANATRPEVLVAWSGRARLFGDYAINLDGSVVLKSGVIPYRIEPYKVLACPNPTGHAIWWYLDYGDWGITTFCFAPGAGG
jgi:hypothetical protein